MKKSIVSFISLIMVIILLASCVSAEKAIIGTWKNQTTVLGIVTETTYVFNEDGTGKMSNILTVEFTYAVAGDIVSITTNTLGIENTAQYNFKVSGNTLTLSNTDSTLEFEKVN